jgi:hypothetical protein
VIEWPNESWTFGELCLSASATVALRDSGARTW